MKTPNPHLKKLGKKLFLIAVEFSRFTEDHSKKAIIESVKACKGRKKMSLEDAAFAVVECINECNKARSVRIWRKAGRTVLAPRPSQYSRTRPMDIFIKKHASRVPLISVRLSCFKAKKLEDRKRAIIRKIPFRTANAGTHSVSMQFTNNPELVKFDGGSSKGERYSRSCKFRKTDSSWNIVLPETWESQIDALPQLHHANIDGMFIIQCNPIAATYPEYHFRVKVAVQKNGFSVGVEDGFIVRRDIATLNRKAHLTSYAKTIKDAIRKVDNKDPDVLAKREAARQAREARLQESLATLRLLQGGRITIDSLNESQKSGVLRAIQQELANSRKLTENFGGIGNRAIHKDADLVPV
jgi:hypothetical protein